VRDVVHIFLPAAGRMCIVFASEAIKPEIKNKMTNTIQAGQTLNARSICDYNCIFSVKVIERKGSFVTVKAQGNVSRKKVMTDDRGEYVYALGKYSMAPIFRA
jgi:hypothetical protein